LFGQFPFLKKLLADNAYAGPIFQDGLANVMPSLATEIIRRCDQARGFVVLPKRWIVERTIGGLVAVAVSPRTGKTSTAAHSFSFTSLPSA
jgi:transposase